MELNDETLRFIREHCKDDVRNLALQAPKYPGVDMPVALTQICLLYTSPSPRDA